MRRLLFYLFAFLLAACSHIDEDEQLIYVKPPAAARRVLIEDFTGQRCINCPKATEEVARLQEQYGSDTVIAVAIHSGPLGFHTNSRFTGLATDAGDEYYNHWKIDYQPAGLVDRAAPTDFTLWDSQVRNALQQVAPVEIDNIVVGRTDRKLSIFAEAKGVSGETVGHLQLWLTEDNVKAFQLMPDGTRNDDYIHQHVLRLAINGLWGEPISVHEGESVITQTYEIEVPEDWKINDLAIVAFVYDDSGVLQVRRLKL